jgi:hypothetical protein
VVRPEHGVVYPAGDRGALLDALRGLLARDDREAMGQAGRAFAEREADVRVTVGRLRELWEASRVAA